MKYFALSPALLTQAAAAAEDREDAVAGADEAAAGAPLGVPGLQEAALSDARDMETSWPPKRGVSKPTLYHLPRSPLYNNKPSCLGEWCFSFNHIFMTSFGTFGTKSTVGLLTPLFGSTEDRPSRHARCQCRTSPPRWCGAAARRGGTASPSKRPAGWGGPRRDIHIIKLSVHQMYDLYLIVRCIHIVIVVVIFIRLMTYPTMYTYRSCTSRRSSLPKSSSFSAQATRRKMRKSRRKTVATSLERGNSRVTFKATPRTVHSVSKHKVCSCVSCY